MKFLALFALVAVCAGAAISPVTTSEWTLAELSAAIENPATDPAMLPHLEQALNEIMDSLHAGVQQDVAIVTMPVNPAPATIASSWTLADISAALEDPATNPAVIPYLLEALNALVADLMAGGTSESIVVAIPVGVPVSVPIVEAATVPAPASISSAWTLEALSAALQDPTVNPELVPYLEAALNELMMSLVTGGSQDSILVSIPVGMPASVPVAPVAVVPVAPVEVAPVEVAPVAPVETPVAPVQIPAAPATSAAPLVQIILNINQQEAGQQIIDAGIAAAPIVPEAVSVIETAPETVSVIETAPEVVSVVETAPETVSVVETAPETVSVVEAAPVTVVESAPAANPIDVIAVTAPEYNPVDVVAVTAPEYNPVDVVAVTAPEVNPIDLLNPVVTPAVAAGEVEGILV